MITRIPLRYRTANGATGDALYAADARLCLAHLPGVRSACCGHGMVGYVQFDDGRVLVPASVRIGDQIGFTGSLTIKVIAHRPGDPDDDMQWIDESPSLARCRCGRDADLGPHYVLPPGA